MIAGHPPGDGILDVAQLRERTLGDEELLRGVVGIFLAELPGWLEAVRQAVEAGDPDKLCRAAHLVAGTGGTCGANRLSESARRLEEMGKEGRMEGAAAEAERLHEAAAELEPRLRELL